jgi:AraC family transcriptional regulator
LFCVELGGAAIDFGHEAPRLPDVSLELAGPAALTFRRLYLESRSPDESVRVEELALALVASLARERGDCGRWAALARDYLHAHFTRRLTLRQIALAAGVHPVHLSRAFPQRFGVTLGGYLRALRVDYAARQLIATDRPIAQIALEAGFCSQSHLTRELRRLLGTTPGAYRRC